MWKAEELVAQALEEQKQQQQKSTVSSRQHAEAPWLCRGTFYIQYETLEELGEGAFGKAMKCRRRRDNQVFVVKIMHESKMSAKAIEEVRRSRALSPACNW